jgi:hypothetical protein
MNASPPSEPQLTIGQQAQQTLASLPFVDSSAAPPPPPNRQGAGYPNGQGYNNGGGYSN